MPWEAVIGLEIHAQLTTRTKIFCGCAIAAGDPPNTRVCPVCLGLPGALPVLNARAVDHAILAAVALGCRVEPISVFARKNYFYPDLPKGYQISQYDRPLALGGAFEWSSEGERTRVRIRRIHLEEDAGKSMHAAGEADARGQDVPAADGGDDVLGGQAGRTCVDFNRSGVPLVEIVTEPDLRSAAAAAGFFERLRAVLVEIGVNAGNLEEGNLRCDANVSVRRAGDARMGTPVEVKNLNSFRFLQRALDHEIGRQAALLDAGESIRHETRLFDVAGGRTVPMRSKEEAHDYRYFPEPDLPPLCLEAARIEHLRATLPELPEARVRRLQAAHGLSDYDARQVAESTASARYFEATVAAGAPPKAAANWIAGELARALKQAGFGIDRARLEPGALASLISLVSAGRISATAAKEVFARMWETSRPAAEIVAVEGLGQIDDRAALEAIVREVVAANPKPVAQYRAGRRLALGFLVGLVMKATGGRANPTLVNEILRRELEAA